MFSFAYPRFLLLLLLIPVAIALYAWARYSRDRRLKKFGNPEVLAALMPDVSVYKPPLKLTLRMIALAMIIIALCRPWGGVADQKTTKEGIEVVIAMDASNSMLASAGSDANGPSRMRTAKLILEKLIGRLDNDKVGLIVYAAQAYTLIPVTSDYVSAKVFLNSIDPSQVEAQGTDIAEAIRTAMGSFSEGKGIGKAIILITDAEDLENKEEVMSMAKSAAKAGIQLDVVGVGSTSGALIPYRGGYLKDENGNNVTTALNEELADEIARVGSGIYVNANDSDALNELQKQLDKVKKTALESSLYAVHDELFAVFLWIAFAFIIADIFVIDSKNSWLRKISFFNKEDKK